MASLGTPKTWIPYMNTTDCSQGFCSLYCPQWCYIIFPPPPPFEFPDDNSGTNFSPLVIAIIGILASAFLLVSYYTLISKYCGTNDSARRGEAHDHQHVELGDNNNPSFHEPWHVATTGLDEALIKSITLFKYKKGDGLIEGTDCSVCLSEFREDESIRLLPKCSHAFHVPCIDTWLRSHSNCPLCRANIVFFSVSQPQLPPPVTQSLQGNESLPDTLQASENVAVTQDLERVAAVEEEIVQNDVNPKTPFRVFSDLGSIDDRNTIIEIRDDGHEHIRRSVSMDHACHSRVSVADILDMNQRDEVIQVGDCSADVGSSSKNSAQACKSDHRSRRVLNCVLSPITLKRPFSRGRLTLSRQTTVHETSSPV